MDPTYFQKELLKTDRSPKDLDVFRKIIAISYHKSNELNSWRPVIGELLNVISSVDNLGNEVALLASHAFSLLSKASLSTHDFEENLLILLESSTSILHIFDQEIFVKNLELFKLIIAHGYLQMNFDTQSTKIYVKLFEVISGHCTLYTRYTYFAYKILYLWLRTGWKSDFWTGDVSELESKLETIIFSNWDNGKEIGKLNTIHIFATYLKIMGRKYNGFLEYFFNKCVQLLSWNHITKYVMLGEVCNVWNNIKALTEECFIARLFESLLINRLNNASTKVYLNIAHKLNEEQWKQVFCNHIKNFVLQWETINKYGTIQTLCKRWLEPIVEKYRNIIPILWELCDKTCEVYRSNMQLIASKNGMPVYDTGFFRYCLFNHNKEIVQLNTFATCCYMFNNHSVKIYSEILSAIKNFLLINANIDSTSFREGILKYFQIFLASSFKLLAMSNNEEDAFLLFFDWLYDFCTDSFEIGSSYQRKALGLNLYNIIVCCTWRGNVNELLALNSSCKEAMCYGPLLRERMESNQNWKFLSRKNLFLLLKLVLDPASDIKEISSKIIIKFFDFNILTIDERKVLFEIAVEKCNSTKFFEVDSGVLIFKILAKWTTPSIILQSHETYVEYLLQETNRQLLVAKNDILKAATFSTPLYGVVTALLTVGFDNGPENDKVNLEFSAKVLEIAEDAVAYFLQVLSHKSETKYSSSFAEMGMAINEAIKNSEINYEYDELALSPGEQAIISCIWRSLKALCEIGVKVAMHVNSKDIVQRVGNLIVSVLLRCRHKGAIEAAGVSIFNLTKYLCTQNKYTDVLESFLKTLLINDSKNARNLTRRGAGLTIMFHKIIIGDIRKDRPLLHSAVNSLLESLSSSAKEMQEQEMYIYDNPCAMYLHFLKTCVADKELQQQLSCYTEEICRLCFQYLSSKIFTIRNASLLLFGALVSRLVGQSCGVENQDFGYGYSFNHFVTHYPILAEYTTSTLRQCSQSCKSYELQLNVIPILSLYSKMFFSGCDFVDGAILEFALEARQNVEKLLTSPIGHIRNLAAKVFVALVSQNCIELEIRRLKDQIMLLKDANSLQGHLCALQYLHSKWKIENAKAAAEYKSCTELWNFWICRCRIFTRLQPSYFVEAMLIRSTRDFGIWFSTYSFLDNFKEDENFDSLCAREKPGFFEFIDELVQLFIACVSKKELDQVMRARCSEFPMRLLVHAPRDAFYLEAFFDLVCENGSNVNSDLLELGMRFTVDIMKNQLRHDENVDLEKLNEFLSRIETQDIHSLKELKIAVDIANGEFDRPIEYIEENCSVSSDVARRTAAEFANLLFIKFNDLPDTCKAQLFIVGLKLLKDQECEIREIIATSVLVGATTKLPRAMLQYLTRNFPADVALNILKTYCTTTTSTVARPVDDNNIAPYEEESKFLNDIVDHVSSTYSIVPSSQDDLPDDCQDDLRDALYLSYEENLSRKRMKVIRILDTAIVGIRLL